MEHALLVQLFQAVFSSSNLLSHKFPRLGPAVFIDLEIVTYTKRMDNNHTKQQACSYYTAIRMLCLTASPIAVVLTQKAEVMLDIGDTEDRRGDGPVGIAIDPGIEIIADGKSRWRRAGVVDQSVGKDMLFLS